MSQQKQENTFKEFQDAFKLECKRRKEKEKKETKPNALTKKFEDFLQKDFSEMTDRIRDIQKHVSIELWLALSDISIEKNQQTNILTAIDFINLIEDARQKSKKNSELEFFFLKLLGKMAPNLLAHFQNTSVEDLTKSRKLKEISAPLVPAKKLKDKEKVSVFFDRMFQKFSKKSAPQKNELPDAKELPNAKELTREQKSDYFALVCSEMAGVTEVLENDFLSVLKEAAAKSEPEVVSSTSSSVLESTPKRPQEEVQQDIREGLRPPSKKQRREEASETDKSPSRSSSAFAYGAAPKTEALSAGETASPSGPTVTFAP